jgi:predicted TIM-barrel fold metal-dependent hydrolase
MPFVKSAWIRPDYVYSAEDFLRDLDAHGIQYGVIAAASLFGTYNDYTIDALRRHKRLRGTAILDPRIDRYALEAMRADGIVGARLQWFFVDPLPDMESDDFQLLCRRLRDLGMHIHLNIEGKRLIPVATRLAETGVKLVIDHFGWHDPAPRLAADSYQQMLRLMERGRIWVKISSGFRRPDWELPKDYTQDMLARFGPERLLWGSDAPFVGDEDAVSYGQAVALFNHMVPDENIRQALGAAAFRFYFAD